MPARRHAQALINLFDFVNASDFSWNAGAEQAFESAEREVLGYISRGIPCGVDNKVTDLFLQTQPWGGRVDLGSLWKAYAAGGYIAPDAPVSAYWRGELMQMLPLEAAIVRQHTEALKALIESGADLGAVQGRSWLASRRSRTYREAAAAKDILGFLKFAVPKSQVVARQEMEAVITKALMLRRIDERPASLPVASGASGAGEALPSPASIAAALAGERRRRRAV